MGPFVPERVGAERAREVKASGQNGSKRKQVGAKQVEGNTGWGQNG